MKPSFTLNLSHEGIALLHKSPRGTWTAVGDVPLDDPDLRTNLSFLRSTAVGLEGKGFGSRLVIPNSQVLYREVYAPGPGETERRAQIMAALEGQTPYDPADLTFDWTGEGQTVLVAVVAKETLDEAEEFAVEHRFNPLSFIGKYQDDADSWEPYFGRSDYSFAFLGAEVEVRDTPLPPPPPSQDDSLFADAPDTPVDEAAPPAADQAAPDDDESTSFFSKSPDDPGANFFTDNDAAQDAAEGMPPAPPAAADDSQPTAEPAEAPVSDAPDEPESDPIPAFASRRHPNEAAPLESGDRPIERLTPRIAIAGAVETSEAVPSPASFIAEDRLRAGILGDEDDTRGAGKIGARLGPVLAAMRQRSGSVGARLKSTTAALPRLKLAGAAALGKSAGGISAATRALAALRKRKPAPEMPPEAAAEPHEFTVPDAPEAFETPATDEDAKLEDWPAPPTDDPGRKRRTQIIAAAAVLVVLGLAGLLYALFSPGDQISRTNATPETTAEERGVRADNRAQARPSDFETTVARYSEPESVEVLAPVRPERRSLFETAPDPDAGLPDTAEDATDLTAEEIAAIRRSGIDVPEATEIAEDGDDLNQPLLDEAELAAAYTDTGILQGLATPLAPLAEEDRDDIFVAALDRPLEAQDATILPDFNDGVQDNQPRARMSPMPANAVFDFDARGLVRPTAEGALNPEGIPVKAGKPAITPPAKPETEQLVPPNPLLALKPKSRPEDLKTGADAIFVQGRLTMADLQTRRGKARPEAEKEALESESPTPTELAVLTSYQPAHRPSDFDDTVAKTRDQMAAVDPATTATGGNKAATVQTGPVLPTRASVAKQATIKNAINLGTINLIGVSGTPNARSALLRLPSGRFVRAKTGDRVDGGKIAAIGVNSLSYVKSGRNRTLKIPE